MPCPIRGRAGIRGGNKRSGTAGDRERGEKGGGGTGEKAEEEKKGT